MRQALRLAPSRSPKCDLLGRTAAELAAVAARWEEVLQRKEEARAAIAASSSAVRLSRSHLDVCNEADAELFSQLQALSPCVQRGDYYDGPAGSWDHDGLWSDLKLTKKDAAIEGRQQVLLARAAAAASDGHMLGSGEVGDDEGGGGGDEGDDGGDSSDGSDGSDGEAVELPRGRWQKSKKKGGQRRRIDRAKRLRIENREALARFGTEQAQPEPEPEPEPEPGYKCGAASASPSTTRTAAAGDGTEGGVEGASAATAPQSFAQTMRDVLERRGRQSVIFGHVGTVTAAADVAASDIAASGVAAAGAAAPGTGAIGAAVREAVATAGGEGGEGPAEGGAGRKKRRRAKGCATPDQRKAKNNAREDLGLLKLVKAASHAAAGSRSGRCMSYTGVVEDDDGGGDDGVVAVGLATGGGDGVQATSGEARGGRAAAAGSSDAGDDGGDGSDGGDEEGDGNDGDGGPRAPKKATRGTKGGRKTGNQRAVAKRAELKSVADSKS